jgi:hypothetical protein
MSSAETDPSDISLRHRFNMERALLPVRLEQLGRLGRTAALPIIAAGAAAALVFSPTLRHTTYGTYRYAVEGQRVGDPLFCVGSLPRIEQIEILGGSGQTTPEERAQMDCGISPLPFGADIDSGPANVPGPPVTPNEYRPAQNGLTPSQEQAVS